jgi:hypothetical protein
MGACLLMGAPEGRLPSTSNVRVFWLGAGRLHARLGLTTRPVRHEAPYFPVKCLASKMILAEVRAETFELRSGRLGRHGGAMPRFRKPPQPYSENAKSTDLNSILMHYDAPSCTLRKANGSQMAAKVRRVPAQQDSAPLVTEMPGNEMNPIQLSIIAGASPEVIAAHYTHLNRHEADDAMIKALTVRRA